MSQGCLPEVSRVFQASFKEVSRKFKGFSRKIKRCFEEDSRVFQGNIRGVSRKFVGCSSKIEGYSK